MCAAVYNGLDHGLTTAGLTTTSYAPDTLRMSMVPGRTPQQIYTGPATDMIPSSLNGTSMHIKVT